eukprot:TRINITY_DN1645_c0_g1_i2.p1 TRINITY_DN1645_c0_g1~~TRINITY_DN1645_c0_g1_i2.p1  ORF type:complete len:1407 (-),score=647.45 TRINITY_DN1645_c0_g1_i2:5-4201(-)
MSTPRISILTEVLTEDKLRAIISEFPQNDLQLKIVKQPEKQIKKCYFFSIILSFSDIKNSNLKVLSIKFIGIDVNGSLNWKVEFQQQTQNAIINVSPIFNHNFDFETIRIFDSINIAKTDNFLNENEAEFFLNSNELFSNLSFRVSILNSSFKSFIQTETCLVGEELCFDLNRERKEFTNLILLNHDFEVPKEKFISFREGEFNYQELQLNEIFRNFLTKDSNKQIFLKRFRLGKTILHYCTILNYTPVSTQLATQLPELLLARDDNGTTPLHLAIFNQRCSLISLMLNLGANLNIKDRAGESARDWAEKIKNEKINEIIKSNVTKDTKSSNELKFRESCKFSLLAELNDPSLPLIYKQTVRFFNAAYRGHFDEMELLIKSGIGVDTVDAQDATAMHIVAYYGYANCLQLLINTGAKVDVRDAEGATPLHKASYSGEIRCMMILLQSGASINALDNAGGAPIHIATQKSKINAVQLLLNNGGDCTIIDQNGCVPLHYACSSSTIELVQLLLTQSINICNQIDIDGNTPLSICCSMNNFQALQLLFQNGANVKPIPNSISAIHRAVQHGNIECVQLLISAGAEVNFIDSNSETPLHISVSRADTQITALLLEFGADPTIHDATGATALHKAAKNANLQTAQQILDAGTEVDCQDFQEATPLHYAAKYGAIKVVELFLATQANLNAADSSGASPLHWAVRNGQFECAQILFANGALLDSEDDRGQTPIFQAIEYPKCINFLLESGADPNSKDKFGHTVLYAAVKKGCEETVRLLTQRDADVTYRDESGNSLIDIADEYIKRVLQDALKERDRRRDFQLQKYIVEAVKKFNTSAKEGLRYAQENGLTENHSPEGIAKFLHNTEGLSKAKIGEVLGEVDELYLAVLKAFVEYMNFTDLEFDTALRHYLSKFRLPGEAQKIDRIMERFAHRYCENTPGKFPSEDSAYLLAFAVIMLNTDAHSSSIKHKMTKEQFIRNNTGLGDNNDLPHEYLAIVYDRIISNEIKMETGDFNILTKTEKEGWLVKQGGRIKTWKKRWFILSSQSLYYFASPDSDRAKPIGVITLENLVVREYPKKKLTFELYSPNKEPINTKKMSANKSQKGHHDNFIMSASTELEVQEWIEAIRSNCSSNPLLQLMQQKKKNQVSNTVDSIALKSKKSKNTIIKIDFEDLLEMATMCSIANKNPTQIKEIYGLQTIIPNQIDNIGCFARYYSQNKKTRIAITGTRWESATKLRAAIAECPNQFGIQQIADAFVKRIQASLRKDSVVEFCGYALGAVCAYFMAIQLREEGFKIDKVITFGSPKFIKPHQMQSFSDLTVLRVIEYADPVCSLFPNFLTIGSQLILLNDEFYCKLEANENHDTFVADITESILAHHHISYYIRYLKTKTGKQAQLIPYEQRTAHI